MLFHALGFDEKLLEHSLLVGELGEVECALVLTCFVFGSRDGLQFVDFGLLFM